MLYNGILTFEMYCRPTILSCLNAMPLFYYNEVCIKFSSNAHLFKPTLYGKKWWQISDKVYVHFVCTSMSFKSNFVKIISLKITNDYYQCMNLYCGSMLWPLLGFMIISRLILKRKMQWICPYHLSTNQTAHYHS